MKEVLEWLDHGIICPFLIMSRLVLLKLFLRRSILKLLGMIRMS